MFEGVNQGGRMLTLRASSISSLMTWCENFDGIRKTCPLICISQWIIVDGKVYDVSKFKDMHPGGTAVLLDEDIRTIFTYP